MARGGYRPGSGPKKGAKYKPRTKKGEGQAKQKRPKTVKPPGVPADIADEAKAENLTPLEYMNRIMNDPKADKDRRDRMAIAAAPFVHARPGVGKGKKDERGDAAKKAGSGKFAPSPAPLKAIQGGK